MSSLLLIGVICALYFGGIYTGWIMHRQYIKEDLTSTPYDDAVGAMCRMTDLLDNPSDGPHEQNTNLFFKEAQSIINYYRR